MSISEQLAALAGEWVGTNELWLDPQGPPEISQTTMSVELAARGQALILRYAWEADDVWEEGVMLLSLDPEQASAHAVWTDSWHLHDTLMVCHGERLPDGGAMVAGHYAAPPGPDWGWSITIEPQSSGAVRLLMHNISPEGKSALAVQAVYRRRDAS